MGNENGNSGGTLAQHPIPRLEPHSPTIIEFLWKMCFSATKLDQTTFHKNLTSMHLQNSSHYNI